MYIIEKGSLKRDFLWASPKSRNGHPPSSFRPPCSNGVTGVAPRPLYAMSCPRDFTTACRLYGLTLPAAFHSISLLLCSFRFPIAQTVATITFLLSKRNEALFFSLYLETARARQHPHARLPLQSTLFPSVCSFYNISNVCVSFLYLKLLLPLRFVV